MKNRMNKKGFSFIELMIVVVIMGILVAIAVPLYGAVTNKANKSTCQTNQQLIKSTFSKWLLLSEENNTDKLFKTSEKSFDGSTQSPADVFADDFISMFEQSDFPQCPQEENYYIITATGNAEIRIDCYSEDNSINEFHNNN